MLKELFFKIFNNNDENEYEDIDNLEIKNSLKFCKSSIKGHRSSARRNFVFSIIGITSGMVIASISIIGIGNIFPQYGPNTVPSSTIIAVFAITVMVFGAFMALNRYHLNEIAKYEHYILAFRRLNIAGGINDKTCPILIALTNDPFSFTSHTKSKGSVSSPIPGHPTSDLTTIFLNKLLDNFELSKLKTTENKTESGTG